MLIKAVVTTGMALVLSMAAAGAEDLHQLWDRQCGGCHGHAADFVRQSLVVRDGILVSRDQGRVVATYLVSHNGGYSPEQIRDLMTMMTAQAGSTPDFRKYCGTCHDSAAQLVRDWVVRRDGVLVGRGSGKPLADFLRMHGRADPQAKQRILDVLTRVESEVNHR